MARHKVITLVILLTLAVAGHAQTPQEKYAAFKKQAQEKFDDFRKKANQDYSDFLLKSRQKFYANEPIEPPQPKPVPPIVRPDEDNQEQNDEQKPYDEVIVINPPKPQPSPVEPIKPIQQEQDTFVVRFFGTEMECAVASKPHLSLNSLTDENVSNAWQQLSDGWCDGLLAQCLNLRSQYFLCDWGYLQLLDSISHTLLTRMGKIHSPNEATLLMAWLYCQSGYKMRLGHTDGTLYMLFACENVIYQYNRFLLDDVFFYPYGEINLKSLEVWNSSFPQEKALSLQIHKAPNLEHYLSDNRTLQSKHNPEMQVTTYVNRNIIDFYDNYPYGALDNQDFGTIWAMYATAPLSEDAKNVLYPQLEKLLAGKSKLEAAEELLYFVQTAFVYEWDTVVWGEDRAFFAEESLFYPYVDCEDRSILYSRLVRDLLDLNVVLLYYPGHLATAVHFEGQQPTGDYFDLPDGRYYIADPTILYGAPIGISMPEFKGVAARVITLPE